jgi:hypothetical protein
MHSRWAILVDTRFLAEHNAEINVPPTHYLFGRYVVGIPAVTGCPVSAGFLKKAPLQYFNARDGAVLPPYNLQALSFCCPACLNIQFIIIIFARESLFQPKHWLRPCHSSGEESSGSSPGQVMWNLWWPNWHCGKIFSEYFGIPCQFSLHRLLHTHHHHLSSGAGTIGQLVADVPSALSFTPLQET